MAMVVAERLQTGDQVRVVAISRTLGALLKDGAFMQSDVAFAVSRLDQMGLRVTFGRHVEEYDEHLLTSVSARVEDLHEAFADPGVKAVLAVTGGIGAIQLLDAIDYGLIAANPKIVCGYSDVAFVLNAIQARTGLVTYYGPNFSTFMMRQGAEFTLERFRQVLFTSAPWRVEPSLSWSDDNWAKDQVNRSFLPNDGFWPIQSGVGEGVAIGGSAYCLNMLQGSAFFPGEHESILFLESPGEGKASLMALDNVLRALSYQPFFDRVRGIVLGRYARSAGMSRQNLTKLIRANTVLAHLPVIANVDFGHTAPMMTLPIGGHCRMRVVAESVELMLGGD